MFVDRKKKPISDLKLRFWQRDFGALWTPFEHEKIIEFSRVKADEKISISGYVKWITNNVFALVPTLFSNQIHLLCLNNTDERPRENSYVTLSGFTKWIRLRNLQQPLPSTVYEGDLLVQVEGWKYARPEFRIPKTTLDFHDFSTNLTSRIEGLEPKIKDFLAFTAISTPMFYENIGGINLTLYDSTKSGLPKLIIRELERVMPQDIGSLCTIKTPFGRFGIKYKYSYLAEDADKPLSRIAQTFLAHKTSEHIRDFSEASLSLFSTKDKPVTIEDPPCSLSDIPTVVPEEMAIFRSRPGIDQFDALKFIIINHMKTPVVEDFATSLNVVVNSLEKLTESWELDSRHLGKYGFLNANYSARPTSIIRKSLAYARAHNIDVLSSQTISKVFNEYFKWNFEYVYEIWEDLLAHPLIGEKPLASLRVKYRDIIRIIRRYQSTHSPSVSEEDIIREASTPPSETKQLIIDCLRDGVIYEPVKGYYRLTRELA